MPRTDWYSKLIHFPTSRDVRFTCPHQIFSSKERASESLKNQVGKNSEGKKRGVLAGTCARDWGTLRTRDYNPACRSDCRLHCICYSFPWAKAQITAGQSWLGRQKADHSCPILAGCVRPLSQTPRKPVPVALGGLHAGSSSDASSRAAPPKRCQSDNFSCSAPRGNHEGQVLSLAKDWIKFWGCYTYLKQ